MGEVLNADQRRHLDGAVQRARTAAELAAADALRALAVSEPSRPSYLGDDENALRLTLREKARQLGDNTTAKGADLTNLTRDVAYEQWHRLLFARFLEVNGLLRHPDYRDTPLTLEDCSDLAEDLAEPDGWAVAARFASEILPGVFRLDDPAFRIKLASEHRLELERILLGIPSEVFVAEDALGWVYQFWQTSEKKRVNQSGVKIGGADLAPVTQLFTENYMVRFLLENSLGAWWAARHPDSLLIKSWEYLRRNDDGTPAAGSFDEWPATAAEVTVMDPCCGSGHFLVAMFGMLWRMRAEEEGLDAPDAQDAVLRDNLHGLELDPRCTQIATFNLALESWKQGGFRQVPTPQIACSGVPVRSTRSEWAAHAGSDAELATVLAGLHADFVAADTLGSLITPRPADLGEALFGADLNVGATWESIRSALTHIMESESNDGAVLARAADDVVHAADLLSRPYILVVTNPPYLQRTFMDVRLQEHIDRHYPLAKSDLATAFIERCLEFVGTAGTLAIVSPQSWLLLTSYQGFRERLLKDRRFDVVARLGSGAFRQISGEVVKVSLSIISGGEADRTHCIAGWIVNRDVGADAKAVALRESNGLGPSQRSQLNNPDTRITLTVIESGALLERFASGLQGLATADYPRFGRKFWERPLPHPDWSLQQSTVGTTQLHGGRQHMVWWEQGRGALAASDQARIQGLAALGKLGVAVSQMGGLPATLFTGELFDNNTAVIVPNSESDLPAIWAYCSSPEFGADVRDIDDALKVTNATLVKVAFDLQRWQAVANEMGPLPDPSSPDPTQWLYSGVVSESSQPLQVAVARLLGYRWPDQVPDELDHLSDVDGIAALQSLPSEPDLATRLREVLAAAFADKWSSALERSLVVDAGGKNGRLEDWLRDKFFEHHVKVFDNRPFLWHIWDGRKDGFSVVVNYHRLDHRTLEKLTFTSLGAWIERQKHEVAASRAGADSRLAAAEELQEKLKLILEGEEPYDVFVRWKALHEQPIGWNPDLNDGVRLNIRPFVTAGILRSKVNVHWKKDRGTNADGSERVNDLHPTLNERREARRAAGVEA